MAAQSKPNWLAIATVFGGGLLLVSLLVFSPHARKWIKGGRVPAHYTGVVLQKSVTVQHTKYGSEQTFHLLVRTDDGRQFTLTVPASLHREAQVGSRIRMDSGDALPRLEP